MRPALLTAAVLTALVPVTTADAAPRESRHLIADPSGDVRPAMTGLDITCADVVFGAREVVATMRLADAPVPGAPAGFGGGAWNLGMTANGVRLAFRARTLTGLNEPLEGSAEMGEAALPVTFKVSGTTLTWRVERARVKSLTRRKIAVTGAGANTTFFSGTADAATGPGTCVL